MIVYIQNCNLSQIPLVISTGDSWLNPAKYFEACHSIIMTNIFLAKQVPPWAWAWLGWCLVTRQERAGLATVKLRARDQAPHLPSLYTRTHHLSSPCWCRQVAQSGWCRWPVAGVVPSSNIKFPLCGSGLWTYLAWWLVGDGDWLAAWHTADRY